MSVAVIKGMSYAVAIAFEVALKRPYRFLCRAQLDDGFSAADEQADAWSAESETSPDWSEASETSDGWSDTTEDDSEWTDAPENPKSGCS